MIEDLPDILNRLINQKDRLRVRFPEPDISVPELAYQVAFPRLEIVLEGELRENGLPLSDMVLSTSQVLYVQAGKWTCPQWTGQASTLSILFGRQKLGFCIQHWDGKRLRTEKQSVARLGPRVGSYLLLALNEICLQPDPVTARLVVSALLSHCLEQLVGLEMRPRRTRGAANLWAATRVADAAEVRARKQWVSTDRYDGEERSPGVRRAWGADGWGALMAPPRPGEQVPGQQTRMGCYAARVWAPLIDGQDRA